MIPVIAHYNVDVESEILHEHIMIPTISPDDSDSTQRYRDAAARLLAALNHANDPLRLSILKQVACASDDIAYPRFLKLLLIIGESDDVLGKRIVADTLAAGLRCADLPTGEMTAWGGGQVWQSGGATDNFFARALHAAPTRRFGPVEYLTVWFCQKTQRPYLSSAAFEYALAGLLDLISINVDARERYPRKILDDLGLAAEGAYTRSTRVRLKVLAEGWLNGFSSSHIARLTAEA